MGTLKLNIDESSNGRSFKEWRGTAFSDFLGSTIIHETNISGVELLMRSEGLRLLRFLDCTLAVEDDSKTTTSWAKAGLRCNFISLNTPGHRY